MKKSSASRDVLSWSPRDRPRTILLYVLLVIGLLSAIGGSAMTGIAEQQRRKATPSDAQKWTNIRNIGTGLLVLGVVCILCAAYYLFLL